MGFLQSYSSYISDNSAKVLTLGTALVVSLFCFTLVSRPLPSFNDPFVGFEARDTLISARLNAWKLLVDETSASANNLSLVPNSPNFADYQRPFSIAKWSKEEPNATELSNSLPEPPIVEMSTQLNRGPSSGSQPDFVEEDDEEDIYYKSNNFTQDAISPLMHYSLSSSSAFCGKLYDGYAQVVISPSSRYSTYGLFNINSMLAICQLDRKLRLEQFPSESRIFQNECERFQSGVGNGPKSTTCCNSWSLPNFIACLNNKTSCMEIDGRDLKNTDYLLNLCSPYYLKAPYEDCFVDKGNGALDLEKISSNTEQLPGVKEQLPPVSENKPYCGTIPEKCLKCNGWTYFVMHYLVNENFIHSKARPRLSSSAKRGRHHNNSIVGKLAYTNVFLPMAKSSSLMSYYQTLSRHNLKTNHAQVRAMDLGLKNPLFEHLISNDVRLFIIALVSILFVMTVYTWSLLLSLVVLLIICLSLCLSFTIYELVLNIPVFPFMNLLSVVISFGICSDNAMLFCKQWSLNDTNVTYSTDQPPESSSDGPNGAPDSAQAEDAGWAKQNLDQTLRKALMSTFAATFATACSFLISAISQVIAVRCFCIFATLSVMTNYLLIITLLPPALVLDSKLSRLVASMLSARSEKASTLIVLANDVRQPLLKLGKLIHNRLIFNVVTRYKFYLVITFVALLACSSTLVFYNPTLQPSDEDGIQLLSSKHPFEQYNKHLKRQFAFERAKTGNNPGAASLRFPFEAPDTLPIRVVFGVKPTDNGYLLDPHSRGTLTFDPAFDMTDPKTQTWLLEFCRLIKRQRFIYHSAAPELTNCFMDTFRSWMGARSCTSTLMNDLDRSPCCQIYEFPYGKDVIDKCVGEAVDIIRKTPQFNSNVNAGLRFYKNSSRVAAMIIEYQSNRTYSESFTKMDRFFNEIDDWVGMQTSAKAPLGIRSGWFISSSLELLALQKELAQSTFISILLEIVFAIVALSIGTRDLVLTIAGALTIGTIIIMTVAALILLKWTLGVAESILISLIIGLSIDFALHYTIAFSERRKSSASHEVIIHSILSEIGSPITLAATTTSLAGFVIFWSDILAYQELGIFLMLIALISWLTSNFLLLPMLDAIGTLERIKQFQVRLMLRRALETLANKL